MKLEHIDPNVIEEAKASAKLCKSSKPNSALGASNLASCKSKAIVDAMVKNHTKLELLVKQ